MNVVFIAEASPTVKKKANIKCKTSFNQNDTAFMLLAV